MMKKERGTPTIILHGRMREGAPIDASGEFCQRHRIIILSVVDRANLDAVKGQVHAGRILRRRR